MPHTHEYLDVIEKLKSKWPSTFVPRPRFAEFTSGLYSGGYMANCDSAGQGPEGGFFVGKTKCYPVESAISWLKARARATEEAPKPARRKKA